MRSILGAATLALALVVGGCGSPAVGDPTTLSVWIPTDDSGRAAAFVDGFNASHPGYRVTLRQIPFSNYDNALGQAFSAGRGPDLAQINGTTFPSLAAQDHLQPIVPITGAEGDLATDNFYPQLYRAGEFDGEQLALPIDTGTRVLQYNKKLLARAGVAPFGRTAGYPEILAAAQAVRALGPEYQGFCYVGANKWYTVNSNAGPFVIGSGGSFLSPDGTRATFDSPGTVAGLEFFRQLAATGLASNVVSTSSTACVEGFGAGTVGMQFDGFWDIPSEEQITGDFELGQTLPSAQTTYSTTGGWVLGVPAYVPPAKFDLVREFVSAMYEPVNIVQFTGLMPATLSGRAAATDLQDPQYDIYWEILAENADNPIPLGAGLIEQATLLTTTVQQIVLGDVPTAEAVTRAQAALDATLAK